MLYNYCIHLTDAAAETQLKENTKKLTAANWKTDSGAPWLINIAVPTGGLDEGMKEVKEQVFAGQTVKSLQQAPGGGMAVE